MWQYRSLLYCCLAAGHLLNAANDRISQAKTALAAGKYEDVVRLLEQERDTPDRCEASFYLGLARYQMKQLEQAIIDLQIASQCDAANADARVALAVAYAAKGDDDRALAAFDSAIELKPDHVEALRAAAMLDLKHERNERAIVELEKLLAIEPDNVQTRSDLGAAYAGTGNLEKARDHFKMALKLRPNNASALMGLGNAYLKTGQAEEAVPLLTKAAKIEPKSYEPRFLLAAAYNAMARYADAMAECNEALRLGGVDPEVYYHLARAYRGLGHKEEERKALECFSALRSEANRDTEGRREAVRLINQAKPLVDEGRLPDAIVLLERAYTLDQKNPQVLFRLAGLYYDTQQHQPARRYARGAIALTPSEWRYHYLLGLVEKASGNLDAARESFETTIRLNPSAADAFNQLGNLAMSRGDLPVAIQYFRTACRLDPREQAYQLNLHAAQRLLPPR